MTERSSVRFTSKCWWRFLLTSSVSYLWAISATAQSNVTVRVMAANLNGNSQTLGTSQLNILQGLKADVVAMQEFIYSDNSTNAFRQMIDDTFGTNFVY